MIAHELNALDLLSFPVWIVLPHTEELVFAKYRRTRTDTGTDFQPSQKGDIFNLCAK